MVNIDFLWGLISLLLIIYVGLNVSFLIFLVKPVASVEIQTITNYIQSAYII